MLNHRIRGLLFHYKKNCYFTIGFYFFGKSIQNTLILSVKMTLTMSKMFAGIICPTIEREIDYSTAKKRNVILTSIFDSQSIFYIQN